MLESIMFHTVIAMETAQGVISFIFREVYSK